MSETTLCIVIVAVTMVLFITRAFPMAVTAVLCSLAMGIMLPSVKLSAIYSGFGSAPVCMIAGMMIVGDAIFQTGVAQKMGVAIGKLRIVQNERIFTVVVVTICTFMSAFMSDSGCIAMWMPIIAAVAAGSRGKIPFQDGHYARRNCLHCWWGNDPCWVNFTEYSQQFPHADSRV